MTGRAERTAGRYTTVDVDWPLDSFVALLAAGSTQMCKRKDERDTEFVKRIVEAYIAALILTRAQDARRALTAATPNRSRT